MNTPHTPGMSAVRYVAEDDLDSHGYYPSQPLTGSPEAITAYQDQNIGFDNQYDNKSYNLNAQFSYEHDYPSSLLGNYAVSAVNNMLGATDDGLVNNDFLTSSAFALHLNTIPSPSRDLDTIDDPNYFGQENDGQSNESLQNYQQSSSGSNIAQYGHLDMHNSLYASSQPQLYHDVFGNVISPLQVMNEQYGARQLGQDNNPPADDTSFLIPPLALPSLVPPETKQQPSKPSSARKNSNLVPPPPLPPAAPLQPGDPPVKTKRRRRRKPPPPPEVAAAKHKTFLQRNRQAASKCRTKKKAQINHLEDDERMGRQINSALKHELQDVLGEVLLLREQVNDIKCEDDCDGCGEHAPMRRNSVIATSSIGIGDIGTNSVIEEGEEDGDDEDDKNLTSPITNEHSVDSPLQSFGLFNKSGVSEEEHADIHDLPHNKRKGDEEDIITIQNISHKQVQLSQEQRQSSAYLEGYDRRHIQN